ncbi:NmrA/HSCARG family protein [Longitalea luteola]|uniref:NmrA/HSCARG family protein n=1 Tax=Longitalea luteola TaxID=2812563 RepID=UPI001A96EDA0|nr:NmrA/HSCARG family protein [Longitalea luteola]
MPSTKILTVFGATGAQGGGLARAILQDQDSAFSVRAVTRNPDSDKAKELAELGAEVVTADIDDQQAVENALQGAYGAFFVTFFWAHYSAEKEKAEAAIFAEAARKADLKHVIWSTLEDTRTYIPLTDERMPTLQDKYKVPHFDGKGESDKLFIDAGIPTTFMLASFYWDNFIHFGSGPKRGEDGVLALTMPIGDSRMAGIAAEDVGKCAYGIFTKGTGMVGQRIGIAGEQLTGEEMAAAMSKALGERVVYNKVPADVYRGFGFPGADELGNMFQFYDEFAKELNKTRDVNFSRELNPELLSFEQWLNKYARQIPI